METRRRQELELLSTSSLLEKVSSGSEEALETLYGRYLPRLQKWARGRIPHGARGLLETDDLVQETLLRSLRHVDSFDPEHSGAFLSYLRRAVKNRLVDEIRRLQRTPQANESASSLAEPGPSPLDEAIGKENAERYEACLEELDPVDSEAIVARVELGLSYADIAKELGKPSPGAARMAVKRALVRLAEKMRRR